MNNKTLNTAAALLTCAALLTASGCTENKPAAGNTSSSETAAAPETTAAASETTTAAPETTTEKQTTVSETTLPEDTQAPITDGSYDADPVKHPFRLGVWISTDGNYESEYYDETYYCFREDGGGSFLSQSMGIGLSFGYEMDADDPEKGVFHKGAVDDNSYIEILSKEDDKVKVKWTNTGIEETWTYLSPADEFSFYSNFDLGEMAMRLYGMSQYCPENIDYKASIENGLISIRIFDPTETDSTKSQLIWYSLNRYTGKGYDDNGNEVDLTVLEGGWDDMPYPERFAASPDLKQRHELIDEGAIFGFRYIGYVEPFMNSFYENRDAFIRLFESSGVLQDFRLLKSFPDYRFVHTDDGQELYFILPADEHGSLTVTKLEFDNDTGELKEGETLYSTDDQNYPILLKCNVSEIYPDVLVRMTDSSGRCAEWSPFVSGNDGTVSTANENGAIIHDFTDYGSLSLPEDIGVG